MLALGGYHGLEDLLLQLAVSVALACDNDTPRVGTVAHVLREERGELDV